MTDLDIPLGATTPRDVCGELSMMILSPVAEKQKFPVSTVLPDRNMGLFFSLHVDYVEHEDDMKEMTPFVRGRYMAKHLLDDWITLGEAVEDGVFLGFDGFSGTSALVQPVTLRSFGAYLETADLGKHQAGVDKDHQAMTNVTRRKPATTHKFLISNQTMIDSLDLATERLKRLRTR
jgi:hypothetical protein